MIRIDALWLATAPIDMRMGTERLVARMVHVFGAAQAHHGDLFANVRGNRMKLLLYDGFGTAVDSHNAVAMLVRWESETLNALLMRLNKAIEKFYADDDHDAKLGPHWARKTLHRRTLLATET